MNKRVSNLRRLERIFINGESRLISSISTSGNGKKVTLYHISGKVEDGPRATATTYSARKIVETDENFQVKWPDTLLQGGVRPYKPGDLF